MREKYIEEQYPRYFIFGEHENGKVDVASTDYDTVATVSNEHAELLIKDRDKVIDILFKLAQRFDEVNHEEFEKFWYIDRLNEKGGGD